MTSTSALLRSIDEIPSIERDALDSPAGALLGPARLRQLEADTRWDVFYAVLKEAGRVVALLPMYASKVNRWPEAAYSLGGIAPEGLRHLAPADVLFVGGRAEMSAGLLRPRGFGLTAEALGLLRLQVRQVAESVGRRPLALYVPTREGPLFRVLLADSLEQEWTCGIVSQFEVHDSDETYLASLPSAKRASVRRDRRAIADSRIVGRVVSWGEVFDVVPAMIYEVGRQHGLEDDPRLIRMRLDLWHENPTVACVAFCAGVGDTGMLAVCLGWRWKETIQLYKIGLAQDVDPVLRRLAYVEAMVYAPLRYAAEERCNSVWAGYHALAAKRLRGAQQEEALGMC